MIKRNVRFPCGDLKLEGTYFECKTGETAPAVVVCHPHPLYGGSMHNNVTLAIAEALARQGINTLLFNFRGVGGSQGSYGGGIAEQEDIKAALTFLQKELCSDSYLLGLAGYSFGAGVALPVACQDERVCAVALISPYIEDRRYDLLAGCTIPKLIVGGSRDDLVLPDEVRLYADKAAEPKEFKIIEGADHFWMGYERELTVEVSQFFGRFMER